MTISKYCFYLSWRLMVYITAIVILCSSCRQTDQTTYEHLYHVGGSTLGVTTVIDSLDVPWEICWGPDGHLWYAEQSGKISNFNLQTKERKVLLNLKDVYRVRTAGLLGMVLHPNMAKYPYVFVAYTAKKKTTGRESRVVRYTLDGDTLVNPLTILTYPAWSGHFGARVTIAPDGKLIVATGDGAQFDNAQNIKSPNGKILRFNIDGTIPKDNPIAGSAVWAWGFRNPQGIVYAANGVLYSAEHGDATDDEVNRIVRLGNYGWPYVAGKVDQEKEKDFTQDSTVLEPLRAWTPTIAPAGMAIYESDIIPEFRNSLLLTTLKGNSLHVLKLADQGQHIIADSVLFQQVFGRLRSVCVAPNGDVYVGTSNRDWNPNGYPVERDDRILRISRISKNAIGQQEVLPAVIKNEGGDVVSKGESLYTNYCASCHKANGLGVDDVFPPLAKASIVKDTDKLPLINRVLKGKKEMPGFGFLADKDLAIVLSYVRKKFGPLASPVTIAEVKSQR